MSRWSSPKLAGYAVLSSVGLLGSLTFARPEIVALTAPFLLALVVGLALARRPDVTAHMLIHTSRALEGDRVPLSLHVEARATVDRLELYVRLPDGVDVAEGSNPTTIVLRAGEQRELELLLLARRWGGHLLGPVYLRARDPLGFLLWEQVVGTRHELRVYPREDVIRRALQPRETQVLAGNEVARRKGEGIEFADIRTFAAGDSLKRINWRASGRSISSGSGELWVNEAHPERNTDVILFLDSFAEARRGGEGTLDFAVRATAALANAYVGRRDRVGLIAFGGILRWLLPGAGVVQLYRIADALLDTEIVLSYYWKEIDVIPRRTLPPNALVIALTPLLDERSVTALLDLRARGFDLAVIDVSPVPFTSAPVRGLDELAYRIWQLRRQALRHRYERAGIAVAEWTPEIPLQAVLEEVREYRRHARHARV